MRILLACLILLGGAILFGSGVSLAFDTTYRSRPAVKAALEMAGWLMACVAAAGTWSALEQIGVL